LAVQNGASRESDVAKPSKASDSRHRAMSDLAAAGRSLQVRLLENVADRH